MKRILFPTMLGVLSLLTCCSDDNTVFDELSPIRAPRYVTMNVSANSSSKFYLYQITLGDDANPDAGMLIVAGLNSPQLSHSYIIKNNGSFDWLSVKGMNLVGDGTLSVSFSQ